MGTIEHSVRPLNERERRLLSAAVARRKRRERGAFSRFFVGELSVFLFLWLLLMVVARLEKRWLTGHESVLLGLGLAGVATPFCIWAWFSGRSKVGADLKRYEVALEKNEAHILRIQADSMIEFEEEEDEGACYAFQLDHHRVVFISGQDYYPSVKFPNSDFSLIDIYGEDGVVVEEFIEKHGAKLRASRTISSQAKRRMNIPNHLQVISGDLDNIEQLLAPNP